MKTPAFSMVVGIFYSIVNKQKGTRKKIVDEKTYLLSTYEFLVPEPLPIKRCMNKWFNVTLLCLLAKALKQKQLSVRVDGNFLFENYRKLKVFTIQFVVLYYIFLCREIYFFL